MNAHIKHFIKHKDFKHFAFRPAPANVIHQVHQTRTTDEMKLWLTKKQDGRNKQYNNIAITAEGEQRASFTS